MNRITILAGLSAVLMLTGCASTKQFVPLPDQSKTVEDPAKGRIYVMRPASVGGAVAMNVTDGGTPIGTTGPRGFLCWERDPGDVIVSSTSENTSRVSLAVRPGSVHYVVQHVRMGIWIARTDLEIVTEDQGKLGLMKCKAPKYQQQQ